MQTASATLSPDAKRIAEELTVTVKAANDIRNEWKGKEKDMPGDVEERFDKAMADAGKLEKALERQKSLDLQEKRLSQPADDVPVTGSNTNAEDVEKAVGNMVRVHGKLAGFDTPELKAAFKRVLLGDHRDDWSDVERKGMQAAILHKAQSFGQDTAGGYLVTPVQFVQELITEVKNQCFIRGLARNIPVIGAASLGVPTLETDLSDADWTSELTEAQEDQVGIGKRELKPNYLSKLVTISRPLLRMAAIDPEGLVADRAAYKFAVTEEKAFLIGDGNKKPLGVMVSSNDGIKADRDVESGTVNDFKGDDLIEIYGSMKPAYRPNANWIFHRDGMTKARKLKDGVGNYIWQPFDFQGRMLTGAYPGLILGRPYYESEYMPNTYTTGNYYCIFGDFSKYWIATNLMMEVQVLLEKYALTNKNGYVFRMEVDGMPVLSEAFARGLIH